MFIHFSWLQYGVAVVAALAAWYGWLGWRYYRPEIRQRLFPQDANEKLWADDVYEPVGRSAAEEGSLVMDAEELDFAEPLDLLGTVPDLLEEIKDLVAMAETKEDFLSLFRLIAAKYPQVAGSPQLAAIQAFIREQVSFSLTDVELNQLFQ